MKELVREDQGKLEEVKLFVATKVFIAYQGKVLLLRELTQYADGTNARRYDVVGGRVTPGERLFGASSGKLLERFSCVRRSRMWSR